MKRFIYQYISKKYMNGCSDYNSLKVRRSCRSKSQARDVFEKLALPYAKGASFWFPFKAFAFVKKHGFPVVVKPNVSGYSRGSHFPINDYWHLLKACIMVKKWWPVSIIENYLLGANYRIVLTTWGVMSLIRRYPPFIDGNAKDSISVLIDIENSERKKLKLAPVIFPIKKNRQIISYLKKQGLLLNSIPAEGKRVYLYNKVALKPGGIVEVLDQDFISEKNKNDLMKLLIHYNSNILGIDVICEHDISVDFNKQKAILLEINSRPYLKMHAHPRYGKKEDLSYFYKQLDDLTVDDKGTY